MEQKLNVTENSKDGKLYKNVKLKDLEIGNHCIIEKVFAEGKASKGKYGESYNVSFKYNDEIVSTFLKPKEHEEFKACGDIGAKIKVLVEEARFTNPKTKLTMLYKKLIFSKV